MKGKLLILLLTVLTQATQALGFPIEGNWGMQQSGGGIIFDVTFSFLNNRLTLTNVCSGYGQVVTAQVSTAVIYNDNSLTVLEAHQDQKSAGGLDCNISVQPDQMNYQVQGNYIIFSKPGSNETFTLIRK